VVLEKDRKDQLDPSCEKLKRILRRVQEDRNILHAMKRRKVN
jgi:hypothetical protein